MAKKDANYEDVAKMFRERMEAEMESRSEDEGMPDELESRAYSEFKQQYMPKHLTLYENICKFSEKYLAFKPDPKSEPKIQEAINTCHLETTPTGVYSASLLIPLVLVFAAIFFFFMIPLLLGGSGNMFFVMFFLFAALAIIIPLQKLPLTLAKTWRMKASNQMVLSVFYIVTYMRHTSNLERAIAFASEHLSPPLSMDMRKVIWDVETEKYESVKDSLAAYLETWRKYNMEYVESMHLIQASLFESSNERRLNSLDKSLEVMLSETYEKMIHYAHNLKGPLTTLNMLGVVLPILTLVILPLVVSFMEGFRWWHLFAFYNMALPVMVFYLGKTILATRPGGSGEGDITAKNPELKKLKKVSINVGKKKLFLSPLYLSIAIALVFIFIGLIPLIWSGLGLVDYGVVETDTGGLKLVPLYDGVTEQYGPIKYQFLNYRERMDPVTKAPTGEMVGPFGLGAVLFSLFIPLGIGLSIGTYFKLKSKKVIKIREQSKKLELEFSSALFQLGSRIGDGIPAEIAFGKVASEMQDTTSGKFFMLVHTNITRLGMNVNAAIFDTKKGAMQYYPSDIIESSMKVLVESSRKGPLVASQALMNVSDYIKQMHRVDERLQDLMGDTITSMKSQTLFLTPVISGIVVGITSMITKILGKLSTSLGDLASSSGGMGGSALLGMFGVGIPTYQFQIVVGLYVVQLAFILTVIGSGIKNGPDKVGEQAALGSIMMKSTKTYVILAFVVVLIFNIVAGSIVQNVA